MWGFIVAILAAILKWRQKDPEVKRLETIAKEQKEDAKELVKPPRGKQRVVDAWRVHAGKADR